MRRYGGKDPTNEQTHHHDMKTLAFATTIVLPLLSEVLNTEALATASNEVSSAVASKILRSSTDYHLLEEVPHDTSSFTYVSVSQCWIVFVASLEF